MWEGDAGRRTHPEILTKYHRCVDQERWHRLGQGRIGWNGQGEWDEME